MVLGEQCLAELAHSAVVGLVIVEPLEERDMEVVSGGGTEGGREREGEEGRGRQREGGREGGKEGEEGRERRREGERGREGRKKGKGRKIEEGTREIVRGEDGGVDWSVKCEAHTSWKC